MPCLGGPRWSSGFRATLFHPRDDRVDCVLYRLPMMVSLLHSTKHPGNRAEYIGEVGSSEALHQPMVATVACSLLQNCLPGSYIDF